VDKNLIITKINKAVQGAVLEVRRFGRSDTRSIWVEAQSIQKVAKILRTEADLSLDWLENLSVVELSDALVISYFLHSTQGTQPEVSLRASVVPDSPTSPVKMPTIQTIWPMGIPMEREAREMFGIQFEISPQDDDADAEFDFESGPSLCLPSGLSGFPLRKKFNK
jgi:hypothetical protein